MDIEEHYDSWIEQIDTLEIEQPEAEVFDMDDNDHLFGDDELDHSTVDEEYDEDEIERRKVAYRGLKRNDKIFGNTYNTGLDYSGEEEDSQAKGSAGEIKLDSSSPDYHLQDSEKYLEHVDLKIVQRDIHNFMSTNKEVITILGDDPEKKKFSKSEINQLFNIVLTGLTTGEHNSQFVSPIYVLDSISSSVNMEYKKLFDMMAYENKELLLLELNKKYGFLDSVGKNYKMF